MLESLEGPSEKAGFLRQWEPLQGLEQGGRRDAWPLPLLEPCASRQFCLRKGGMESDPHIPCGWIAPVRGDISLEFSLKGRDTLGNVLQTGC